MPSSRLSCPILQVRHLCSSTYRGIRSRKPVCVNKYPVLEPVSGAAPKLTSGDKLISVESYSGASTTLLCPAQGYPVPSYRWGLCSEVFVVWFLEPVGVKAPQVSTAQKTVVYFLANRGDNLALVCPAQGFPVPIFRYLMVVVCF